MRPYETLQSRGHFIAGGWRQGKGSAFVGHDPSGRHVLWTGQKLTPEESESAFQAATNAFDKWSELALEERVAVLERVAELVREQAEELAVAIAASSGKPLWEARTEVAGVAGKITPSAAAAKDRAAEFAPPPAAQRSSRTFFKPHGPVLVLGPYNFPVHMMNAHIVPSLLAGNTVVAKPSALVPLPAEMYADCFARAGVPPGVFNLVQGDGEVGEFLARNSSCRAICFTGSVAVGEHLERIAVERQILIASEKGGNSPLLVWEPQSIRGAVYITLQSCFGTAGQRCSSARRLVVKDDDAGHEFVEALIGSCKQLAIGDPFAEPPAFYGPLINREAAGAALAWQEELESLGARSLLAAHVRGDHPALVSPGIVDISAVPHERVPDKEIMGPVVTLRFCSDFDDALRNCNATKFGLAAGIVTKEEEDYRHFARVIEAGVLTWNAPITGASAWGAFGGVKHSGNYRPTGYYSADSAVRAVGATEKSHIDVPEKLPPGMVL